MRSAVPNRIVLLLLAVALASPVAALAQDPQFVSNSGNIGMPANGVFSGSDFETVQLNNGNLHIEIPIWSQKGRGLDTGAKFVYDSAGWGTHIECVGHQNPICNERIQPLAYSNLGLSITSPFGYAIYGGAGKTGAAPCTAYLQHSNYTLKEPDGTKHHFLPDPAISGGYTGNVCGGPLGTMYADDGSGWILHVDPSSGAGQYAISKSGVRVTLVPGNSTDGLKVEDPNGNFLYYPPDSTSSNAGTDTLGRTLYQDGSYYDSNGNLQHLQITSVSVPIQTNFTNCNGPKGSSCASDIETWSLPQTITFPNGASYTIHYDDEGQTSCTDPIGCYGQPVSLTLPTGGQISWTWYAPLGTGDPWGQGPLVKTRTETSNGNSSTWTYSYKLPPGSAAPYSTAVVDQLGNKEVTSFVCSEPNYVDNYYAAAQQDPPCHATLVQYYQNNNGTLALVKTEQTDYATSGALLPIRETTTWASSNQVSKEEYTYASFAIPNWTGDQFTWSGKASVSEYGFGTGSPGALMRTTNTAYLALGNSNYLNNNLLDLVSYVQTNDADGNQVASTVYYYDETGRASSGVTTQHDSNPPTGIYYGNQTSVNRWLNATNGWIKSKTGHYDTGEVYQTTDPLNNSTYFYYDAPTDKGAFLTQINYPDTTTNNVTTHHIEKSAYDFNTGLRTSSTDENNNTTTYTYDSMRRPLQIIGPPDPNNSNRQALTSFFYNDTSFPISNYSVRSVDGVSTTTGEYSWRQFDGLGREARSAHSNGEPAPNVSDEVDTCYDALGRVSFTSYPFQAQAAFAGASTCAPGAGDTNTYDALGRITQVKKADASIVTTDYSAFPAVTVTDEAGRKRRTVTDALGRLTTVCEPDPSSGAIMNGSTCLYETDYTYDVLGNLLTVNQHGGDSNSANWRTRTFTYDSLSRLTKAVNPESGTITYGYDGNGNLTSKTSPAPNQTGSATVYRTYSYDPLNRLTGTCNLNSQGGCIAGEEFRGYTYDTLGTAWGVTPTNSIGRLVLTDSFKSGYGNGNVATIESYDVMGRVTSEVQYPDRNSQQKNTFTYAYNLDGTLKSIGYPSGRTINYTNLNSGGTSYYSDRPASAVDTANNINYATGVNYTAWGELGDLNTSTPSAVLGAASGRSGGVSISRTYNSRMQPAFISATAGTNTVFNLGYDFHSGTDNGNIYTITNNLTSGRSQNFTYDYLNRVLTAKSTATTGNCWGESYTYDMWANLTGRTVTQCSGESPPPGVTNKNQMAGYSYDAAGNPLSDPAGTYSYNDENEMVSNFNGVNGAGYDYDADEQRVEKSTGTLYWYGKDGNVLEETDLSGNLQNEYIFLNGERVARRDSSGNVFYYFEDQIGSTRVMTDASGNVCYDADFFPFGGEQHVYTDNGNCSAGYKFTGKLRDPESGLDYFGARYFSSGDARFMTPDWAAKPTTVPYAKFGDPQSLNLYGYVENEPVNRMDPDGHCPDACVVEFTIAAAATAAAGGLLSPAGHAAAENAIQGLQHLDISPMTPFRAGTELVAPLAVRAFTLFQKGEKTGDSNSDNVPNPHGSEGKPDHRAKVGELSERAKGEAAEGETVESNRKIKGHDSSRRPDVQILDRDGKTRKIYEAERHPESTRNVERENEYNKLKIPNETHPLKPPEKN